MKLVICEKPSVGAAVAAALGVREKKDGYIEGNGYVISWCIGHLVGLAEAAAYICASCQSFIITALTIRC